MGICNSLEPENFIRSASASAYDRYIRVTSLCLDKEDLIPFVENLKRGNRWEETKYEFNIFSLTGSSAVEWASSVESSPLCGSYVDPLERQVRFP